MMEEGNWDNPPGHDSGLVSTGEFIFPGICACGKYVTVLFQYVEEDELVDALKNLSTVKKEHTMFTDTHL